jgi:hypothetical protein
MRLITFLCGLLLSAVTASAQAPIADESSSLPGDMMTRDESGKATVRATRLREPLAVDGRLDDRVYTQVRPFDDLIQVAPEYGRPATERSEIWVMYDAEHLYVAARLWDDAADRMLANELRRDADNVRDNDHFGVMLDTFHDRRSGFILYTNVLGARADYSVVDEGGPNRDWNPVWESRTVRFERGWTVEMAIPFKSLRYVSGSNQTWGFQVRRSIRHKNEMAYLNQVPRQIAGPQAFNRISSAGTLVGLDLPPASKNLELKPYAYASVTTDRLRTPALANAGDANVGGDIKYGVTANLTADVTFNTDFAQVEVDEQQVNLTRFSLFFPEKRDFFLEGRGVFEFGSGGGGGFGFGGPGGGGGGGGSPAPQLFYSRRIGLNGGRIIPLNVGGRLTGKVGPYALGVVNIQTGADDVSATPGTNFTVLRVKRDILRRSSIGAMFTNRSVSVDRTGTSQAYGVDAAFSFYQNLAFGGYLARTVSPTRAPDDTSYQARFDYGGDRYGASASYLKVGDDFNPEIGFVRRDDFKRSFGQIRFSPRPAVVKRVRKYGYSASVEYIENGAGFLESRQQSAAFNVEFDNSDRFNAEVNRNYEFLEQAFPVARGVSIPVGGYGFSDVNVSYSLGSQHPLSGTISLARGQFYDGDITSVSFGRGRTSITERLSVEPSVSISAVSLPHGDFVTRVLRSRVDYGFSPWMFASALLQYNHADRTFSSNFRYRWEYRPGSELFVVWTDEQDTRRGGIGLRNRAFVVKATRLLRF